MRNARSEIYAHVSAAGPFLVRDDSKTIVHCIEKSLQTGHVQGGAEEVTRNFLTVLEDRMTRTFLSILKDVSGQPYSQRSHHVRLKFVSSEYVLGGLSLTYEDRYNHCIKAVRCT